MKRYGIMLSQVFPSSHPRCGEQTGFGMAFRKNKRHTIRANYRLWSERFRKIMAGEACLVVRQWLGAPYRSKTVELAVLTKDDGIGLQRLDFNGCLSDFRIDGMKVGCDVEGLAQNDGLSEMDWLTYFKDYDLNQPMAIIHFTGYRYE